MAIVRLQGQRPVSVNMKESAFRLAGVNCWNRGAQACKIEELVTFVAPAFPKSNQIIEDLKTLGDFR